jgi:hypothetical protein
VSNLSIERETILEDVGEVSQARFDHRPAEVSRMDDRTADSVLVFLPEMGNV